MMPVNVGLRSPDRKPLQKKAVYAKECRKPLLCEDVQGEQVAAPDSRELRGCDCFDGYNRRDTFLEPAAGELKRWASEDSVT
jgi:hypothetical protein